MPKGYHTQEFKNKINKLRLNRMKELDLDNSVLVWTKKIRNKNTI